ncbi:unnamed protein product [Lactuca saligna]|uniref:Peptidase C1A papain C-terminal domain-containing protein n=1 Tax=Lactuca saligna TaxID=75948 RepID=A0AA35ZXL3_LACSI|nr:unnamed protein product [Lactuca saligna]
MVVPAHGTRPFAIDSANLSSEGSPCCNCVMRRDLASNPELAYFFHPRSSTLDGGKALPSMRKRRLTLKIFLIKRLQPEMNVHLLLLLTRMPALPLRVIYKSPSINANRKSELQKTVLLPKRATTNSFMLSFLSHKIGRSPVKNQGSYGSCWTFSTTGGLEAAYAQAFGKSVSFSEQQLVDCARDFNNFGCNGGLPSQAYEYIKYNGGLDTEESYPYTGKDGVCKYKSENVAVKVIDSVNITMGAEDELKHAVGVVRPVSVAFQVINGFHQYTGGVFTSNVCGNDPMVIFDFRFCAHWLLQAH